MAASAIITPAEFVSFYPDLSKGWEKESEKIKRLIEDAQTVDLRERFDLFYFEMLENLESETWSDFFNGSTFDFEGFKNTHEGLKKCLASLTYIRYLGDANKTHTPHGYVSKVSENSKLVTLESIKDEQKSEQKKLSIWFKNIDNYLSVNFELFRYYKSKNKGNISYNNIKTNTLR
ncbi:structural protein [Cellulophaga phage phi46:1]|uniref:structural protein n=1 Tax=Cellulophaga phage phi46:1 TaxID=1327974 RepID=UPI00035183CC|nr:structural protein [Cellulophaga phage phi46:1]AGO47819.1 structural protein [Cellulophaga phage phi46:1]